MLGMEPFSVASTFIEALPLVGAAFRRILERNMQVGLAGWFPDMEPIYSVWVFWDDGRGQVSLLEHPSISAMFQLTLINYRTDRKERLIGARVILEKRVLFHRSIMAKAPLELRVGGDSRPFPKDILFEPQSAPHVYTVQADGPIVHPIATFPRRSKLVLEMDFVGPMRKVRRTLTAIKHDPRVLRKAETRT